MLIIALVLLVLLWVILRRRGRKNIRTIRPEHLADRGSVIGAKLGHGGGRHGLAGARAGRLTLVPGRHEKQQKLRKAKGRPEKSREQTGRPQWEIVKPRQPDQEPEKKLAELTVANEMLRCEVEEGKNAAERLERKIAELTAANEGLQAELAQLTKADRKTHARKYEDEHRVVDDVKQKLCRKCGQWKAETEFHKNASRKDGPARWCKVCKTNAAKKSRERRADVND